MPKIHLYLREQVCGDEAQIEAIDQAAQALRLAIEAAGGAWHGAATIEPDVADPPAEPPVEIPVLPIEPASDAPDPPDAPIVPSETQPADAGA